MFPADSVHSDSAKGLPLAIDAMGGDNGLRITLPGALAALRESRNLRLIIVGEAEALGEWVDRVPSSVGDRIEIEPASDIVLMEDSAATALRSKPESSMRVALELVQAKRASACVSAGNTGPLMALSRSVLRSLPGIDRPALVAPLPAQHGQTYVLDLGANVNVDAEQLLQFGLMGSALVEAAEGIASPSVGLLNVGSEHGKGGDSIKRAAGLLDASSVNYVGFVEGDDVFLGKVDVVVCDGFAGNVMLKACEGFARFMLREARSPHSVMGRVLSAVAAPALQSLGARFDPRHYNGASLLGLNGIVVKSHGATDVLGFRNAILTAASEAAADLPIRIGAMIDSE